MIPIHIPQERSTGLSPWRREAVINKSPGGFPFGRRRSDAFLPLAKRRRAWRQKSNSNDVVYAVLGGRLTAPAASAESETHGSALAHQLSAGQRIPDSADCR